MSNFKKTITVNTYSLGTVPLCLGTEKSYGFEKISFSFSPEWSGLFKTVTFYPPKKKPVSIEGIEAGIEYDVPAEVTARGGVGEYVVSGYADGKKLYSVSGTFEVLSSRSEQGVAPDAPTPTEIDQIRQYALDAKIAAEEADIAYIKQTPSTEDGGENIVEIGLKNGETYKLVILNGRRGEPGDPTNLGIINGIGTNSIATKTSVALGENSVALGEHAIAGANVITIPSSEVKVSISRNESGVTIKFVNPSPIVWICPFRIKCTGYGENDWIYISGEYDPAMGIVIPYDKTPIDISEESIDLTAIESVFSYIAEMEQPTDIQATAVGRKSVAAGDMSYAEGGDTLAAGERSHAEGSRTRAHGFGSHTEGVHTYTSDNAWFSHAEGGLTKALNERAHAEGSETVASGGASHAEGAATRATGNASHSEGHDTDATGIGAHSEGRLTQAIGFAAHAEGLETISQNEATHTEGYKTKATAAYAHAEGQECEATGVAAHAEGVNNKAKGIAAHAEGQNTIANNNRSHAEGLGCQANGDYAHVGGLSSIASQSGSFLHGWELRDSRWYQAVFGLYNEVPSIDRGEQLIVGCGSSAGRANCFVAGNSTNLGGKYIKIGNTTITESQLIGLLDALTPVELNDQIYEGLKVTLPYTGAEMAKHPLLTIRVFGYYLKQFAYYNSGENVEMHFDASSYSGVTGAYLALSGTPNSKTFSVMGFNEI